MQLKKIELDNFRPFKGKHEMFFSTDKDKNVTLVIAENGGGKTTLSQAFQWCLYGTTDFINKEMLNSIVKNEMKINESQTVSVIIELEHLGVNYRIKRSQTYRKDSNDSLKSDASKLEINEIDKYGSIKFRQPSENNQIISSILPSSLSKYFFFDGERIEKMSKEVSDGKSAEFKDAVQNILGLTALNKAMEHLNPKSIYSVIGRYNREIDENGTQEEKELRNKINVNQEKIEKNNKRIDELESSIESYKRNIDDISEKLFAHKDSQKQQEQLNLLNKDVENLISHKANSINEFDFLFSSLSYKYLSQNMIKECLEILKNAESIDKGIPDVRNTTIDYLINHRKKCLCGADLHDLNSKEVKELIKLLDYIPPQSVGNGINSFQNKAKDIIRSSDKFYENLTDKLNIIRVDNESIDEKEHRIGEFDKSLLSHANIQIQDLKKTQQDYERTLKLQTDELNGLKVDNGLAEGEIRTATLEINKMELKVQKNNLFLMQRKYAEAVYDMISSAYESEESRVRKDLQNEINSLFESIYEGGVTIEVDDKYKIKSYVNDLMDATAGLETNTAKSYSIIFAFIVGIIKMAREKANKKSKDNIDVIQNSDYPLVMDAPLSSFDQKRIENICSVIPSIANQVIIFINTKDGNLAKKYLESKVGIEYNVGLENPEIPLSSYIKREENK